MGSKRRSATLKPIPRKPLKKIRLQRQTKRPRTTASNAASSEAVSFRPPRKWAGLATVPFALLIGGCGQGGATGAPPSGTATGGPLTGPKIVSRKRFEQGSKAICARANKQRAKEEEAFLVRRAQESGESIGLVGEMEMMREVMAPSLRSELEALEAVGLPKGGAYEAE